MPHWTETNTRVVSQMNNGSITKSISLKIPRADRMSTDNRGPFGRIPNEPYPHGYKVVTLSDNLNRLIPTEEVGLVHEALWSYIKILKSTTEITLGLAARAASTSARAGISCQCKGPRNTKRCKCHRESKQCSVHCHRDENDCGNLSGLATHTKVALVDRPRRQRARSDTRGK